MRNILIIAKRILLQLRHDPRFILLSVMGPIIIIFMFKVFVDSLPTGFPSARYIMPVSAYVVHFICFILSMVILVQERQGGTLERMLINGVRKIEIIVGYLFGYLLLATLQTGIVLTEAIVLFEFSFSPEQIFLLFLIIWILSMASVSLGLLLSSFARHLGHVIPFIPMVAIPSVFLSGLMVDFERLPGWAQVVGKFTPFHYANNAIQPIIQSSYSLSDFYFWDDYLILLALTLLLLVLTSFSMRETVT